MNGEIIVGLITAASAVICQIIISLTGRKQAQQERSESQQLIIYRLDELAQKVTRYDNIVDRTYKLEQDSALMKEQISAASHRITDLENEIHHHTL